MKKLLLLAFMFAPYVANAEMVTETKDCILCSVKENKFDKNRLAEFKGTVEKHLSRDAYQFIDQNGRILAEVDGPTWRAQDIAMTDGVMTII